jgi:kynureninase
VAKVIVNAQRILKLDERDPLRELRERFKLPHDEVYLDGNSLGPLLFQVRERLQHTIDVQWGQRLIRSWNESWIELPGVVASKIAPLVGAPPEDLTCADSVSVNIFKILAASLTLTPARPIILSLNDVFPTDLYISEGLATLLGAVRCKVKLTNLDQLEKSLDDQVNVLLMSQVNFRSGEAYDVKIITELAHRYGVRVLWDLSHSVGVLPVNLAANHVDFAVGCGYKFLNGGPGAPAFVYVNHELQQQLKQPLTGWMGHSAPFDFNPEYQPAPGIDRFLAGTPGILGMSALDAALDLWREVCLDTVVEKSQHLSRLFIEMVQQSPVLNSPENNLEIIHVSARGSQVSLRHPQAFAISQALIDCGIICDFRFPDLVRFGFAPLYIRYQDILTTTESLAEIMSTKRYQQSQFQQPGKVT